MPKINDRLSIPDGELTFAASRSGGPGGQHVNKVSTRVTLYFDLERSSSLTDAQRSRIRTALAGRVGRDGRLRVICGLHRSRAANRDEAIARFVDLLRRALETRKPRRKTRTPSASRRKRLEDKRRRGEIKRRRSSPSGHED